jgi:hypothetical protein
MIKSLLSTQHEGDTNNLDISSNNIKGESENNVVNKDTDDDINLLNGDNDVNVGITPDVKQNDVKIQLCSCSFSFIFHCFSKK